MFQGPLAQLVERHVYTVNVIGSIPVGPTIRNPCKFRGSCRWILQGFRCFPGSRSVPPGNMFPCLGWVSVLAATTVAKIAYPVAFFSCEHMAVMPWCGHGLHPSIQSAQAEASAQNREDIENVGHGLANCHGRRRDSSQGQRCSARECVVLGYREAFDGHSYPEHLEEPGNLALAVQFGHYSDAAGSAGHTRPELKAVDEFPSRTNPGSPRQQRF